MKIRRALALTAVCALALAPAACGKSKLDEGGAKDQGYEVVADPKLADGSSMKKFFDAKKIKIGVKYDQPMLGNKNPSSGKPEGFDVEVSKIIAGQMGLKPDQIEFVETISKNREPFIQQKTVDLVLATYSITDARKQVISFGGPYYLTGQQLLIQKKDKDTIKGKNDLKGKKVCSVTGSASLGQAEKNIPGATVTGLASYGECNTQLENGSFDAVTTDGAILLGYAAGNPDKLMVVDEEPFSKEKYGVGLSKDDKQLRDFVNDALQKSYDNGSWKKAWEATLGKSKAAVPSPPPLERY